MGRYHVYLSGTGGDWISKRNLVEKENPTYKTREKNLYRLFNRNFKLAVNK